MISGAGRGLGRAITDRLLADGYRLSLGVRDPSVMDGLASEQCLVQPYDAQIVPSARRWVGATIARFGRIDGVVANAGIYENWDVEESDEDALDRMLVTNLKGPMRLVGAAWEHLKVSGSGRVVALSSLSGLRVKSSASTGYAITKHALVAFIEGVRHTGWPYGIRATSVCPGFVATDMTSDLTWPSRADLTQPETLAAMVSLVLALPNNAVMPTLAVNCLLEPQSARISEQN